eukprot:Nitzschia sp. Nitz4//scaffold82_size85912//26638//27363//NITZ4_005135-RA/size85912-processed-gene-0.9-mRNA-1//1//CDS//3329558817//8447//frame0
MSPWMVATSLSPLLLSTLVAAKDVSTLTSPASVMNQASDWYLACLDENPVWTKSVTSGVIQFVGDYCAQGYESYRVRSQQGKTITPTIVLSIPHYDLRRGLAFLVDGLLLSGPLMHYAFELMEHFLPTEQQTWLTPLYHVILNDTLVDSFYIFLSFIFVAVVEGHVQDLGDLIRKDLFATIRASLGSSIVFSPVEYVCFHQLPVRLRVLAMNVIDIVWGALISVVAHRSRSVVAQAAAKDA